MEVNTLKGTIQDDVVNRWAERGYTGYGLVATGVGKSRIYAMAIQRYLNDHPEFDYKKYDHPIVILVNSGELRDSDMPKELKKWGITVKVKIVCYQTAYRWNKKIGLLIADELDFAISDGMRYLQVFVKCTYDHWMGLTGTMIEKKGEIATELFSQEPFYFFPLAKAQEYGLINKTLIWVHEVPLYPYATPTAPYGEISKYKWIQNNIDNYKSQISDIYDELYTGRVTVDREFQLKDDLDYLKNSKAWWESKNGNPNSRMQMMHTAQSLADYAVKLKNTILSVEGNKVIIFSERTAEIDRITPYGYHGKKSEIGTIDDFNSGKIREIGVVRKVNRGVNFHGLNHAIVHALTSSLTNAMQGYIGRMVRLDKDKNATVHFLVSYYMEALEDEDGNEYFQKTYCQNHTWLKSILESEELKHLSIQIFDGINL